MLPEQAHDRVYHMAELDGGDRDNYSADGVDIDCYSVLVKQDMKGDGDDNDSIEQMCAPLLVGNSFGYDEREMTLEGSCTAMVGKETAVLN